MRVLSWLERDIIFTVELFEDLLNLSCLIYSLKPCLHLPDLQLVLTVVTLT